MNGDHRAHNLKGIPGVPSPRVGTIGVDDPKGIPRKTYFLFEFLMIYEQELN
jgi:hypothetical protein